MNLEGFSATRLPINVSNMNHPTIAMVRRLLSVLGQCLMISYSKRIKSWETRSWELIVEIQKNQNLEKEVLHKLLGITEIKRAVIMLESSPKWSVTQFYAFYSLVIYASFWSKFLNFVDLGYTYRKASALKIISQAYQEILNNVADDFRSSNGTISLFVHVILVQEPCKSSLYGADLILIKSVSATLGEVWIYDA